MSGELIGVLIGGGIGLLTAAIGYGFEVWRTNSARAFELRRSVYLDAAASLADCLGYYAAAGNLAIDDAELERRIQPFNSVMLKIHLVGSPAVVAALSEANHELTSSMYRLTTLRSNLLQAIAAGNDHLLERPRKKLFLEAVRGSLAFQRRLVEVNLAARDELGLTLDPDAYRSANATAEQRLVAMTEKALAELAALDDTTPAGRS